MTWGRDIGATVDLGHCPALAYAFWTYLRLISDVSLPFKKSVGVCELVDLRVPSSSQWIILAMWWCHMVRCLALPRQCSMPRAIFSRGRLCYIICYWNLPDSILLSHRSLLLWDLLGCIAHEMGLLVPQPRSMTDFFPALLPTQK